MVLFDGIFFNGIEISLFFMLYITTRYFAFYYEYRKNGIDTRFIAKNSCRSK